MDLKGDFSSYILFEERGDSDEADYDDGILLEDGYDDAMSCSYDRSDDDADADADEIHWGESSCDVDEEHDDGRKKKKEDVYGTSYCDDDDDDMLLQEEQEQKQNNKSSVSCDSSQEFVDEMEKNRLFWEACLAS